MTRVLVIDDEPQIRRFLSIGLGSQGYEIMEAASGRQGLEEAALQSPQLVILDLGLPDMDGMDVLGVLREFYNGPVIILSVRAWEQEKVAALDAGANDYVVKPFGINELLARIRALLRLHDSAAAVISEYQSGGLKLNIPRHRVTLDGEPVHLSRKEFDLLRLLIENSDRIVTQSQIIGRLWGDSHLEDTHYLRILVKKLRSKLQDNPATPRFIETEPGVGYRFLSDTGKPVQEPD
ncbi:MAG: response regulator transcription factor [Gammaproteobacteria bacterium]|nr:response regulator transcription factor [Pseudomonadales bacterium]MCP5348168.1 response regulator transcription factor [Pseudomonadales bacterium]